VAQLFSLGITTSEHYEATKNHYDRPDISNCGFRNITVLPIEAHWRIFTTGI